MSNIKHISYYTNVMQAWSKADHGVKPTEAQLAIAHVHGRPGKQSFIVAMALRDGGVTRGQMLNASALFDGRATPQLNHMRALVAAKMFDRLPVPGAYALTIGPKHQHYADLHGAKAAETVKAEKPAKAKAAKPVTKRKAKAVPVTEAVTDTAEMLPVPVTEMPVEQPVA